MTIKAGYDIVGDVHGRDRALLKLCHKLGYDEWGQHPNKRQLIFLGDLPNKGPRGRRVIRRVESWVESGRAHAIMGNHELEALAWTMRDGKGRHLLPHTSDNRSRLEQILKTRKKHPFVYRRQLEFFGQLPLWLDFGEFRCIHACWDEAAIAMLSNKLDPDHRLNDKTLRKMFKDGHKLQEATDIILRGPRLNMPKKARKTLHARLGKPKPDTRMRWWLPETADMAELAMLKARTPKSLKGKTPKSRILYSETVPVFFGHYHLKSKPYLTAPHAACLDFGAGSGRFLTAYRWSGESELSESKLVSVRV